MLSQKFPPIDEEKKKGYLYEILCNSLGRIFEFPLKDEQIKDLREKLEFCDLQIKPNYIYSTAIIVLIFGVILSSILFAFGANFFGIISLSLVGILSYYLIVYPTYLVKYHRIKASPDLLQTIFYIVVSLRLVPNLESALMFASMNVKGVVGRDLRKMAWDMSVGKYESADEVLDKFSTKWKKENLEFYEAMHLIRRSTLQRKEKRESMLDEAVNVMLEGNMERMKHYSTQLRNPLMMITTLGVTLPVLTVIMFPIMTIFMAESIKPHLLLLLYDILLPAVVYYIMNETLKVRPLAFGVIDISKHPDARPMDWLMVNFLGKKLKIPTLFISILLGIVISLLGIYITSIPGDPVSLTKIVGGLTILCGIAFSVVLYSFFHFYKNMEIRDEIKQIETEFDVVLFQLGYTLSTGIPLETALEESYSKTKDLKISGLFEKALTNIKRLGFTFHRALFDAKYGVIKYFPSPTIHRIMSTISESIQKGVTGVAKTVLSISQYMKSMHLVEEHMRDILDETTSSMKIMMILLVPIACGAVVGMATIIVMVLFQIVKILSDVTGLASAYPQSFAPDVLGSFVDIKHILPAEVFLVVVGVYMLEVIIMLGIFTASLEHGDDPLDKHYLIATHVLLAMSIFSVSVLLIYFIFKNLIYFGMP